MTTATATGDADLKPIPLTQGKLAIVDADDFERLDRFKWFLLRSTDRHLYAVRSATTEERTSGAKRVVLMHREIAGAADDEVVDHIDHDGLNNRKSNLRTCRRWQNMCNRLRDVRRSGYRGVTRRSNSPNFFARIYVNNQLIHLGNFSTPDEAAMAYDAAAREYHGEFARLNFPALGEVSAAI